MARRTGLTLTEVVVTLAILAFGILAILTLFPLAASQMAVAVREDRSGQAAAAADAQFRTYWRTQVAEPGGGAEDVFNTLTNPNYTSDTGGFPVSSRSLPNAAAGEPSYPVVVDPMGWVARSGAAQSWFGNGTTLTNVPRRSLVNTVRAVPSGPERTRYAYRLCSLMDGLGYDDNGNPRPDRELRYNWLWVVQRPVNGNRYAANLTVVVFDNRPHLFAPAGAELVRQTVANGVNPDGRTTRVELTQPPDGLKPGGWVMDATVAGTLRQANLYQVVSISGNVLELQTPLNPRTDGSGAPYTGTFVILPGVSGAYARPPLAGE